MQTMKLLMSAYACEPDKGSEPGVGWRWALETAALGHEVWVITRTNNEAAIARGIAKQGGSKQGTLQHGAVLQSKPKNLHFIYYDLPIWARWWKRGGHGVHLYYLLWQWGAYQCALKLHKAQSFDAVHHITFGVTRHPSFMGRLGIPFIVGPLGGGERAPFALRKYCSLWGNIKDALRDAVNAMARFDPWVRQMYEQAALILLKTPQSMDWLLPKYRNKALCMLEIGVDERIMQSVQPTATPKRHQTLHVLYVGRFIYWKGMDLGLRAIADLRKRGIPVRLTMIGQGPALHRWQALAAYLKLANCVTWVPWMKQQDLLQTYQTFDVLLFPSMHDSSGNVALEAMASGLPVICLDLGGPAELVNAHCGRVLPVNGLNADQVIEALADTLTELAIDPDLVLSLRAGSLLRVRDFTWREVVGKVWGERGSGYQAIINHAKEGNAYVSA